MSIPSSLPILLAENKQSSTEYEEDLCQDALSIFLELQKIIDQSDKENHEAILYIIKFLDKYPFPTFVNPAFLKLAEWFFGNNLIARNTLRSTILKVFQKSSHHLIRLNKATCDTALKKITMVLYSNDPTARILTLRILGYMSQVLYDRVDIQHSVIQHVNSTNAEEVNAVLFAIDKICERSATFANNVIDLLISIIQDNQRSPTVKLRTIKILRHIHHTYPLAEKAIQFCKNLLNESSNYDERTATIFRVLTILSKKSLVHVSSHINFLFDNLDNKSQAIQYSILKDILMLTKSENTLTFFQPNHVLIIFQKIIDYEEEILKLKALNILYSFTKNKDLYFNFLNQYMDQFQKLFQFITHYNYGIITCKILAKSIELYNDASYNNQFQDNIMTSLGNESTKLLLNQLINELQNTISSKNYVIHILQSIIFISSTSSDLALNVIDQLLTLILTNNSEHNTLLAKAIIPILKSTDHIENHNQYVLKIIEILRKENVFSISEGYVYIFKIFNLFMNKQNKISSENIELLKQVNSIINSFDKSIIDSWDLFRISKSAMLNGLYPIASCTIEKIIPDVETETMHCWISCLLNISKANSLLLENNLDYITGDKRDSLNIIYSAIDYLRKAHLNIKTLTTIHFPRDFQDWYIQLYIDLLTNIKSSYAILRMPYPRNSRLEYNIENFCQLAHKYDFLSHAYFDIDSESIIYLERLKLICLILAKYLQLFIGTDNYSLETNASLFPLMIAFKEKSTNNKYLPLYQLIEGLTNWNMKSDTEQLNGILNVYSFILNSVQYIPPFFFKMCTSIRIQVSTDPYWNPGEVKDLKYDENLILKIDGIIQGLNLVHSSNIKYIELVMIQSSNNIYDSHKNINIRYENSLILKNNSNNSKNQIIGTPKIYRVELNKSFFSMTCPILFPKYEIFKNLMSNGNMPTNFNMHAYVSIHIQIIDQEGIVWNVGPDLQFQVEVIP
ncbi:hypothetical protein U3516DRAFT_343785 [Neocallimastix sp. 'constans']